MYKYTVEFSVQDRTRRGLHTKVCKKTVKAVTEAEAIKKIEKTLNETIFGEKVLAAIEL